MNKKGFTLIELVGAILIIALIALLAFPALTSMLNAGQNKVDESVKEVLKTAAATCVNENVNNYSTLCNSVDKLKDNGYISITFYNKYEDIHGKSVTITKKNNKYCYKYNGEENETCTN